MIAPPPMSVSKTILLVDPDADYVRHMTQELEKLGFKVLTADSARQAEELLARTRPDMAITELMLEEMDAGFTLSYHIKKRDPTIAVVLVTNVTGKTDIEFDAATAEERSWVKADAMLPKPVRFEQLLREIERLLKI